VLIKQFFPILFFIATIFAGTPDYRAEQRANRFVHIFAQLEELKRSPLPEAPEFLALLRLMFVQIDRAKSSKSWNSEIDLVMK